MWSMWIACSLQDVDLDDGSTTTPVVVDLRRDDVPPAPDQGTAFVTPDYVIEPFTEAMWCWVTTWAGETTGVSAQHTWQSPMGHHVVVNLTNADPVSLPDGSTFDCTQTADLPMTEMEPLLVGGIIGGAENDNQGVLELPPGMATRLPSGSRLIVQSHYVNATSDPVLVNDVVHFDFLPQDEVETWVAAFVHVQTDLAIPIGASSLSFDCTWEQEANLLFLGGHMHEWGSAFSTDWTLAGGSTSVLYDLPVWDPVFRDAPPYEDYGASPLVVQPGDRFTTNCHWNNDTDHTLAFPEEMCVTFGMFWPSQVPVVCEP